MEASALPAQVGLARTRIAIGAPLLRLRSDEQLVSLFRDGHDDAFRVIHDRYRTRLVAYTRQMLAGSPADAEDAVQEIFVRAYAGLRVDARELALRPWLYRVAHNRCIDELRRPQSMASDRLPDTMASSLGDPVAHVEQRDALRRLIIDVSRLPEQQRSALLMRELGGMTYVDLAAALGLTVPAVKSVLVRARVSLAAASQARDATCAEIQSDLVLAHDRGVRCSGLARRHLRDCDTCRGFRSDMRSTSRQLAALVPLGPLGAIASLLGLGGTGGGSAAAGSGAVATGGAGATAGLSAVGAIGGAGHVATLIAAAVVTAGGAIELQQHIAPHAAAPIVHGRVLGHRDADLGERPAVVGTGAGLAAPADPPTIGSAPATITPTAATATSSASSSPTLSLRRHRSVVPATMPLTELLDPDHLPYSMISPGPTGVSTTPGAANGAATTPGSSAATSPTAGSPATGVAGVTGPADSTATGSSSASASSSSSSSAASSSSSSTSVAATSGSGGSSGSGAGGTTSTSSPSGGSAATSQTSSSTPASSTSSATGATVTATSPTVATASAPSRSTAALPTHTTALAPSHRPATSPSRLTARRHTPGATFVVTGRS